MKGFNNLHVAIDLSRKFIIISLEMGAPPRTPPINEFFQKSLHFSLNIRENFVKIFNFFQNLQISVKNFKTL